MTKSDIRQLVATNLQRWMDETPGLHTQMAVAKKAKIGQAHISRCLNGTTAITIDVAAAIAGAFGRQPWELMIDPAQARQRVIDAILGPPSNPGVSPRPFKRVA